MKSRMLITMLAAATLVAFAAAPASAVTWGGEVFGAFNTHSMSDWNDLVVTPINQGGGNMDDFGTGFGGGLGVRIWPSPNFMVAGTWEPLFVSREEKVSSTDFKVNANSFQASGYYFFPTTSQAKFGIGAGVGFYSISGEISGGGGDLSGSTVGFHFLGTGEFTVSPGFAITGSAGYRIANVSDTKLDDQSSNPEFETDYSGLMLRAGLAFYMPSAGGQ